MNYIFEMQPHDAEPLLAQVSRALEKRTELMSRKQYASLWKVTDRLNERQKDSAGPGRVHKGLTIFNLILGSFLLLTALLAKMQGRPMDGTILFVGVLAVGVGILRLRTEPMKSKTQKRFDRAAGMLLERLADLQPGQIRIIFDENGMEMWEGEATEQVPYGKFECIVEEEDLFLVTFDGRALVLPKADLTHGSTEDLRNLFLNQEKILHHQV